MKIAIVGYGKMGHAIEEIATSRGHEICARINSSNADQMVGLVKGADVAIEITRPAAAVANISELIDNGIPTVTGTTGWYDSFDQVCDLVKARSGAFLYATNFSIGVNVFFEVNRRLAQLMNKQDEYEPGLHEVHHIHKLDAPSGTAITTAEGIIEKVDRLKGWSQEDKDEHLQITDERIGEVPGTHIVTWTSGIDEITLKHEAKNRKGFATGAVLAAEFIVGKQGVFKMSDLLAI